MSPDGIDPAGAYFDQAVAAYQQGNLDQALDLFQACVELAPGRAGAWNNMGSIHRMRRRPEQALEAYRMADRLRPDHAETKYNLGTVFYDLRQADQAIAAYSAALMLDPAHVLAAFNRGCTFLALDNLAAAAADFGTAMALRPDFVEAYRNLAAVLKKQGKMRDMLPILQEAVRLRPNDANLIMDLAQTLSALGQDDQAIAVMEAFPYLEVDDYRHAHLLAELLQSKRRFPEAERVLRAMLERWPDLAIALEQLAACLRFQDRIDDAEAVFARLFQVAPRANGRIEWAILAKQMPASKEEMASRLGTAIDRLKQCIEQGYPSTRLMFTTFPFAYYGLDITPLQLLFSQAIQASRPCLQEPAAWLAGWRSPTVRPVRIGILSASFANAKHVVTRGFGSLLVDFDRNRTEIIAIQAGPGPIADYIVQSADRAVLLFGGSVDQDVAALADLALDALIFTDVGNDAVTCELATARVAPVQVALHGHPVTTGSPNIDYYLSPAVIEPADAEEHYAERLIRTSEFTFCLDPLPEPVSIDLRSELGLAAHHVIYGCLQSLFKLHPDFDDVLAAILQEDPNGILVLVADREKEAWCRRFAQKHGNVLDRVRFIGRTPLNVFCGLMQALDACLDPFHFTGGSTSHSAIGLGVPMVTLEGRFLRGRGTSGLYRFIGVTDMIARDPDEYVAMAIRLAHDHHWSQDVGSRMKAQAHRLFEAVQSVKELEAFVLAAVAAAGRGETITSWQWPALVYGKEIP